MAQIFHYKSMGRLSANKPRRRRAEVLGDYTLIPVAGVVEIHDAVGYVTCSRDQQHAHGVVKTLRQHKAAKDG